MSKIKYFFQFVGIILLFGIFKLLGRKYASIFSGIIMMMIGPLCWKIKDAKCSRAACPNI